VIVYDEDFITYNVNTLKYDVYNLQKERVISSHGKRRAARKALSDYFTELEKKGVIK
jgi:hypothetical protein